MAAGALCADAAAHSVAAVGCLQAIVACNRPACTLRWASQRSRGASLQATERERERPSWRVTAGADATARPANVMLTALTMVLDCNCGLVALCARFFC